MDQTTNPVLHTCAISGEQSPGKHYILTTTEGQEVVCPEALFHNGADRRLISLVVELQGKVKQLEEHLFGSHDHFGTPPDKQEAPADPEQEPAPAAAPAQEEQQGEGSTDGSPESPGTPSEPAV